MSFVIYDTARREKRAFEPIEEGKVSLYVCGLTVYDLPHIGHARTFVVFDVIARALRDAGYEVTLVRNYTDIDDKIIRRSRELNRDAGELAQEMIDGLDTDMAALGIEPAQIGPRVTQHIDDIVAYIARLVDNNFAYEKNGDVYFRVRAFDDYGRLSNRNLDDMQAGARVEVSDIKEDPADFALWKAAKEGDEIAWDSPWGKGRPGWHIECSVMSTKYLGNTFDIHGGGRDLIFPHHENEIAQAKACNDGDFARYWMHSGMVEIDGEKMSHSLGNFWTLRDILKTTHRESLRYFFLTTHYRHNIQFSKQNIELAAKRVGIIVRTLAKLEDRINAFAAKKTLPDAADEPVQVAQFRAALRDDFNTPCALAELAACTKAANDLLDSKGKQNAQSSNH